MFINNLVGDVIHGKYGNITRLEKLEKEVQRVKDFEEIANLHGRYNHLVFGPLLGKNR